MDLKGIDMLVLLALWVSAGSPSQAPAARAGGWAAAAAPSGPVAMVIAAGDGLFAIGGGRDLLATHDGGASWLSDRGALPSGVEIAAVAVDPARPATMYAGGGDGVFKTTDGGASWRAASAGLPAEPEITALLVDPAQPARVLAGSAQGVYRSLDGGATWSATHYGEPFRVAGEPIVRALVAAPALAGTFWVVAREGLFRSSDGGSSWLAVATRLNGEADFRALAIDPADPAVIYAGTSCGVFKSTDGGRRWSRLAAAPEACAGVSGIAIDPARPSAIYVADSLGIRKSQDAGATWRTVSALRASGGLAAVAGAAGQPSILYAATERGVFKSLDGGAGWANLDGRVPGIFALAMDGAAHTIYASGTDHVFKSADGGESWRDAVDDEGLGRPRDAHLGVLAIAPGRPAAILGGGVEGLFRSTDGGAHWQLLAQGPVDEFSHPYALAIDPARPQTIYASVPPQGIARSTDLGSSWREVNRGLLQHAPPSTEYFGALAIDALHTATVYAGGCQRRLFKSTDGGASWLAIGAGLPDGDFCVESLAIDPQRPLTLYAALNAHDGPLGVFRSDDGGETWEAADQGLPHRGAGSRRLYTVSVPGPHGATFDYQEVAPVKQWHFGDLGPFSESLTDLVVDPARPKVLYAATLPDGVFKTTDAGRHWTAASSGLTTTEVTALAIDPDSSSTLYAATTAGIFKTVDGGDHWTAASRGLTDAYGPPQRAPSPLPAPAAAPAASSPSSASATAMSDLTLDHILVGVADLDDGIHRFTELAGVAPARGGQHPGLGTQNALLSLGPHTYLELIAPVAGATGDMARQLGSLHEPTPIGWAIGTRHGGGAAAVARLTAIDLHTAPFTAGGRVRPDGKRLDWRTAELLPPGDLNPFLIEWGAATIHPSSDSPGGCTLESFEVMGPAASTAGLDRLAAALSAPVKVEAAPAEALRLTLRCPAGRVVLPSPAPSPAPVR